MTTHNAIDPTATRATRIDLFSVRTAPMRAFHMTWLAFFVCFYAWFAAAPLMPAIAKEFHLTKLQVANINIAAVLVTVLCRVVIGPVCDRVGPRRAYVGLLVLGAIPVFGLAFAQSYASLLFFRLLIGAIGASFVITQYHTSVMFAPNVIGTANATVGGWGNAGAGAAQTFSPLLATLAVSLGIEHAFGWRAALFVPGVAMLGMAVLYWRLTQDLPQGDLRDLRRAGVAFEGAKAGGFAITARAARNYRTWLLACCYGGCFGIEIFIHTVAATYYVRGFGLSLTSAGFAAGAFGFLAFFGRPLGGIASDGLARRFGLDGRTRLLFGLMLAEGRLPGAVQPRDRGRRCDRRDAAVRPVRSHVGGRDLCRDAVRRPQRARRRRGAGRRGGQSRRGRGGAAQPRGAVPTPVLRHPRRGRGAAVVLRARGAVLGGEEAGRAGPVRPGRRVACGGPARAPERR